MAEITLIANQQAQPGYEFTFQGAAPVCRTCPFRHACLTLDVGRRYRVERVRPVQHPCALQETEASVVEVVPIPRTVVLDPQSAVVGATVDVERYSCRRLDCPNWTVCAGPTLPSKQRFRVTQVENERAECRIGRTLRRAEVV
jgi:uncharacterized protein (UPF0179 family)